MSSRNAFFLVRSCAISIFACTLALAQKGPAHPVAIQGPAKNDSVIKRPQSFDLAAMDKSVDPCEDFYEYACGTWRRNNPIPSDQVFWARYNQLAEYNREVLHKILEQASVVTRERTQAATIAGDFYFSCMNETAVNREGLGVLKPHLARIMAISSREQLIESVAYLHSHGVPALFEFSAQPDLHDATREIAMVLQGGLGLPDRDYYVNQDDKSKETRARYLAHMAAMFRLAGKDPREAEKEASAVLAVETRLAEATLERVKMRDPKNRDHKMTVPDLTALTPAIPFARFFKATGAPAFADVNVAPPEFFQKLNVALESMPLDDWKVYLKWHVIQANAQFLSDPFVNEDFEFERHYLNGQKEIEPRWKRCVSAADRLVGQALGRVYVEQTFSAASKQRTLEMVDLEEKALAEGIQELPWMTAETKKQALLKLKAVTNKIGYPEKWLDYGALKLKRDDLLGNIGRIQMFRMKYNLGKIGGPLDKKEWSITTPTVNAYYYPPENSINFPAGVLQPPLFDPTMDDAVNFGAIGWLIGHELTHGFDDQGSKFDGQGNLTNWWTQTDRDEFEKRTSCLADQYQEFVVVDDIHLNGRLTLGENTADNSGIRIALSALHKAAITKGTEGNTIDGFTSDQRFFIGFAQQWCANITPERLRVIAKVDPHAPVRFRTLGTLRNLPDFSRAFDCKPGQKMVSTNACRVW
ncbi:MAG TPA: M13 family metallopeptidase [Candidatus Angelobacter sp.]|jgi:predicted metalloendopeptidase|nr:M13 family metallopeptidase [Candidatus Angelobacter sp.]